jgi:hypothetical protein
MKRTIIALPLFFLVNTAFAEAPAVIHVTQPGDSQMTCEEITTEITSMDTVITEAESSKSASNLAGIGASIAGHFAGLAGGGIGAAVATNGANAVVNNNKQTAEERIDAAKQRRTMLMGIHAGKGC